MASAPTSIQCLQKDPNTLYATIARVESHYQFTSTCLRSHIIPRGLTINIHPCVPKLPGREPAASLHKPWSQIIRRAAKGFLTALKTYHMSCEQQLNTEESSVVVHFNGEEHTLVDMTIIAIDKVYSHDSCLRNIRESRWIRTLGTSYPSGMNLSVDSP